MVLTHNLIPIEIRRYKSGIIVSEREGRFVSRRDNRVSHLILTGMRILKNEYFFGRCGELTICVRYPSFCSIMLEVIIDNNKVLLRLAVFISGGL